MFDETHTSHIQIAGLSVTGELRERTGADDPFGVFIGFLPQTWLGYGASYDPRRCPPEEQPYDPDAIELIAYDRDGKAIASEKGNNLLSTGGRPPCLAPPHP